jgi:ABC-2 type transport system permease protein
MAERKAGNRPAARGMRSRRPQTAARKTSGSVGKPVERPAFALPEVGPIPAGWRVIGAKEFADHLLSVRFLILLGIVAIGGALLIFNVSGYLRLHAGDVNSQPTFAGGIFPLFLALFSIPPQSTDNSLSLIPSFADLVIVFLGPLLGLAFGFDAVSNERSEGTLPRLVAQPIHRDDVINGKFAASLTVIALILGAVILLLAGIGIWQLGVIPTGDAGLRLITWWLLLVLYVGFWLSLSMLCSVVFQRAATAVLVVLGIWLVVTFFGSTVASILAGLVSPMGANSTTLEQVNNANAQLAIARLLPTNQFNDMTSVLLNPAVNTLNAGISDPTGRSIAALLPISQSLLLVWPQIVTLAAFTAACFASTYVIFMRQEVRA